MIAPSALAGEGMRLLPSFPTATTQMIPSSVAVLIKLASAPEPLSPLSPGFNGVPIEPNDIEPI